MFRNRQSRKPTEELVKNFKASFPQLINATTAPEVSSLADALDLPLSSRPLDLAHDSKDSDATPRGHNEWAFGGSGLTPSVMDPNSQSFNMFANQLPGYYTPTSGGTAALYRSQAGDLHTPGFGGIWTPLSLSTSDAALHASQQGFNGFQHNMPMHVQQQQFGNVNPFQIQQEQQQQTFPPHHFTNQPSYDGMDNHVNESPVDNSAMDFQMHQAQQNHSSEVLFHPPAMHSTLQTLPHPSGENFRFHATLNAPTAMIKHANEIPITYLNKGQAYTLNVVDTQNTQQSAPVRYRTFVRVSFEDPQQRLKPASCWQLWKEGRGTNEAHQRDGRLQAVEYVESGQLGSAEDPSKPNVKVEHASFDGFCVTWSPAAGTSECPISVRFNFLSTDFSHSKGVKGIPVRLCAKTEIVGSNAGDSSEVCYCKVKLFRDHGAERKLSNDVAHVKKAIDKLNQQIAQIESGAKDLGKRKRGSANKASGDDRPGKVPKHRRTWSMSSITSTGGRASAEDDMHMKLMNLQDMFTSARPASVLYLRGAQEDDPDLFPVLMPGDQTQSLPRQESGETTASTWERQSSNTEPLSAAVSPASSQQSTSMGRRDSTIQQPTPFDGRSRVNSNEWRNRPQMDQTSPAKQQPSKLGDGNNAIKIQTRSPASGMGSEWIEAIGVDSSYRPPQERPIKPAACFYAQVRTAGASGDGFHRAVYVTQRTLKDFVNAVALKCNIEPTKVMRTVRTNPQGLQILFDDDCILELPEGQAMVVEVSDLQTGSPMKTRREWDAGPTDVQCDGELSNVEALNTTGYELKLLF